MKKFSIVNCICLKCQWIWSVLSTDIDRDQECPECKSYDVRTFLKKTNS